MSLRVPSLKERKQDLEQLVPLFIADSNRKSAKNVRHISQQAWEMIKNYNWPGNIRELSNVLERCVLLASDEQLPEQWLQLSNPSPISDSYFNPNNGIFLPLDGSLSLQDIEKYVIQEVLNRTDENVTAAARMLGTTRETLRYRVQKYNLRCKP
jgi:transcriptional regulator with PAS, ATPase and Fis domain